ncbi:hypothetical protein MMC12_002911 [Toensbergia leucococca]|nr:hypothetical protein [Toensbergia leucococca]
MSQSTATKDVPFPLVDLSHFSSGTTDQRQNAARNLTEACHHLGFAYVVGHGVSPDLLEEAIAWTKKLFDLEHQDKMKAPHPPGYSVHRGYSHPGLEKVLSKKDLEAEEVQETAGKTLREVSDFKESYEIGSEENPAQPNQWLPEETLPGFRAFTTKFYWELRKTAQMILEAFAEGLNLTEEEKKQIFRAHSGHNNQLRLLHYPPVPAGDLEKQIVARMPAHTDWSSFTLLFQDDCGGLELEDPHQEGKFLPAKPVPNALVLNIGDMLQRLSNDTFISATHRVTLPPLQDRFNGAQRLTRARYSIPYFVAPDSDTLIECLPACINAAHPALYEPVKFKDYAGMREKYGYLEEPAAVEAH